MDIKIVPAKLSDLDTIKQFLLNEYCYNRDDPDKATPDFFGLREDALSDIVSSLPEIIQDDDIIFLLVKSKKWGHILGWAQVAPYKQDVAEMSSLYLTACARRKSIGDSTLKEIIEQVKHRGYRELFTLIQSRNLIAKHFLTNHGFDLADSFELDTDVFIEELRPLKVDKFSLKI
jgi:N-acetylglutamate synthase-like GNAT family acetyltransferase